ncbi:tetratricopeptide repeat protein [Colwellia psychrerythraea]|uniref:Tetratricopeptide repeat-containing protein n=1 Tax=Colwellia psychrerythraea TaxID=28229 RepID=A0A099KVP8_COLPS|nr:tetratricopeptide repeat protein [Colwellia psychrerythraea]KGJ94824.1 Tetratricopeptide repeat-containing protein [Colwellia psychrerythraea]
MPRNLSTLIFSKLNATKFWLLLVCCLSLLLSACNEKESSRQTLQNIDNAEQSKSRAQKKNIATSEGDIRDAYINYLKHASKSDLSRADALNRLAAIEFKLSEELLQSETAEAAQEKLANEKLNRTIELLETSIKDYPKAKHNDVTLYQLAKAYDQQGEYDQTHETLKLLAKGYPKSRYYLEAQFRLAEYAFSAKKYTLAEDKYTEIIIAKNNAVFYEKSLYKRGWSRFKQEFYIEAADDFVQAINFNDFQQYEQLSASQQSLFDEYFRAMGLSFSYLGGVEPLNLYFQQTEHVNNLYYIYSSLSDTFLKQQRYNDSVGTLNSYISQFPDSEFSAQASLKVVDIWKKSGFVEQRKKAFEQFYSNYQPTSSYWLNKKGRYKKRYEMISLALKNHILIETATYHKEYQKSNKLADFTRAERWYKNYLAHFSAYSRQDNIHFLFASLYLQHNMQELAYKHYKLAGFDEQTVTNKAAAYQVITLADKLLTDATNPESKAIWLNRLIEASTLYAQQYPTDEQAIKVIARASDAAYNNKRFDDTIHLAELVISNKSTKLINTINMVKAHAYFQTKEYLAAESSYFALMKTQELSAKDKSSATEGLALAIFYQGKSAVEQKEIPLAIEHYARISQLTPKSETAASGLFDAIALSIQSEQWLPAIDYIKRFRSLYPQHKNSNDIAKKLSVAYLNSKQDIAAAKELEKLSSHENSKEYKMASLLKAADLYQQNNDISSAVRSLKKYIKTYPQPFMPYFEAMYQLTQLYAQSNELNKSLFWHRRILSTDKKTPSSAKNERTNFIASNAAIALARQESRGFSTVKLVRPLKKNLKRKKQKMQASVNYYARASSYGVAETATEATYAIATIYNDFSQALLTSEVPKHLSDDEKEQYLFLLEDQAFPFEEKAIEFYEVNLAYTQDDIYDQWIKKSHQALQRLFPIRYKREPKVENFINVLH